MCILVIILPFKIMSILDDLLRLVTIKAAVYKIKKADPAAEINPKFPSSTSARLLTAQLQAAAMYVQGSLNHKFLPLYTNSK